MADSGLEVMPVLTQTQLKSRLSYDPQTGVFTWLTSSRGKRDVGKQAGNLDPSNGHIKIFIAGKRYYASRLAFLYVTGKWPSTAQIDHRNHNTADNRWDNIRPATSSQNLYNRRAIGTGLKGVTSVGARFRARVHVNNKELHLGYFSTEIEAHNAYMAAATKFYGEFANFG